MPMHCTYCGSNKHTYKNCRSRWDGIANRNSLHCDYCGKYHSHTRKCCPNIPGSDMARENPDNHDEYVLD